MILTKQNINEWLTELNEKMREKYQLEDYVNTISQNEWLEQYEGETVDDAIYEEISSFEE